MVALIDVNPAVSDIDGEPLLVDDAFAESRSPVRMFGCG
jgi:hypothetical protein